MKRVLAIALLAAGCGGKSNPSDAGFPCTYTGLTCPTGSHGELPHYFDDGVTGVPEVVTGCTDDRVSCYECSVTGPGGGDVPCTMGALPGSDLPHHWTVTFTPVVAGTFDVKVGHRDAGMLGADLELSVPVFSSSTAADLLLNRPCQLVTHTVGRTSCDEALYSASGQLLASLDGGAWLGVNGTWLAWEGDAVAVTTVDDAGIHFGAAVSAPRPGSVSGYGPWVALGGSAGGLLATVDGGSLTGVATLLSGDVDVLATGDVVRLYPPDSVVSSSGTQSASGTIYCADQRGAYLSRTFGGGAGCFAPLNDGGDAADGGCCSCPSASCRPAASGQVPRRGLAVSIAGLRVDSAVLSLPDAGRASAGDDFVWQSSDTQTAVWFR